MGNNVKLPTDLNTIIFVLAIAANFFASGQMSAPDGNDLMDEANIETHPYYYQKESLSHVTEFRDAHIARMMEMMHSNYNHPSVVIWSMGNKAGPGVNFAYTYVRAKEYEPMRPVQYERNNDVSDIGCRQYPPVAWVAEVASGGASCGPAPQEKNRIYAREASFSFEIIPVK